MYERGLIKVNTFGGRLRELRVKAGLTQRKLAEKIGAKHNSISDWENDKNKPDADTIELLLWALGTDANTLMGWDNSEYRKAEAEKLADVITKNPKIAKLLEIAADIPEDKLDMFVQMLNGLKKGDKDGD